VADSLFKPSVFLDLCVVARSLVNEIVVKAGGRTCRIIRIWRARGGRGRVRRLSGRCSRSGRSEPRCSLRLKEPQDPPFGNQGWGTRLSEGWNDMSAWPIYTDVVGAPFRIGERVRVGGSKDETFDRSFKGRVGSVEYFEYECGCGQSYGKRREWNCSEAGRCSAK
jgi:hypothetical protein